MDTKAFFHRAQSLTCASRPLHLPQPLAEAAAAAQHVVDVQGGDADVVVRGEGLDDGVRPAHVGGGEG